MTLTIFEKVKSPNPLIDAKVNADAFKKAIFSSRSVRVWRKSLQNLQI
jgi:hypothetical protein